MRRGFVKALVVVVALAFVAVDAESRGGRGGGGRGGGGRGGSGMSRGGFSSRGPASSGSLRAGPGRGGSYGQARPSTFPGGSARPGFERPALPTQRPVARPELPSQRPAPPTQRPTAPPPQTRPAERPAQLPAERPARPPDGSTRPDRPDAGDRQDWLDSNREDWQDHFQGQQEDRQEFYEGELDEGGWIIVDSDEIDWDEDEFEGWGLAGFALGTAVTLAAMSAMSSGSDAACTMTEVVVNATRYYRCGPNWYNKAYVDGEIAYVVVAPPTGH